MQIKAQITEVGITPHDNNGFITLRVDYDKQPTARPVRVPCSDPEMIRAMSPYLYRDVMITIAPVANITADFSRADTDMAQMASDLALAIRGHDIQPGTTALAELVARLAFRLEGLATIEGAQAAALATLQETVSRVRNIVGNLHADLEGIKHDVTNVKHDVTNVKHDVHNVKEDVADVEGTLLHRHAEEFAKARASGGTDSISAAEISEGFGAPITRGVPDTFPSEPGVDTQITPTWIEPAIAALGDLQALADGAGEWNERLCEVRVALEPYIRATDKTPHDLVIGGEGGCLRNDVWLLYRPRRPLPGLDVISLRDGVVALLRAAFCDANQVTQPFRQQTLLQFSVLAFDDGLRTPEGVEPVAPDGAVRLDLDNDYADLWIINGERMIDVTIARGLPLSLAGFDAIVEYLGGRFDPPILYTDEEGDHQVHYKMMARIWATWSGREVKLVAPGEPLVFDQIETPESTLRAQTVRAMRDGTTVDPVGDTPWAGGAVAEDGAELGTRDPIDEVLAEINERRRRDARAEAEVDFTGDVPLPAPEASAAPSDSHGSEAGAAAAADVPDPNVEPDYWGGDPDRTSDTQPAKRKARRKR